MALQLWETLKDSITVYTGLSPATVFTFVALLVAAFYVVSSLFGSSRREEPLDLHEEVERLEPLPPPVQLGEVTEEELRAYDGSDPKKPLLMAIKGQIYDVSQGRAFYGPGGPYALFAGRDASRALAKMSFDEKDLTSDVSGLGPYEREVLQDWEYKFMSKYFKVGTVKKTVPVADGESIEAADREVDNKPAENGPAEDAAADADANKGVMLTPYYSSWTK